MPSEAHGPEDRALCNCIYCTLARSNADAYARSPVEAAEHGAIEGEKLALSWSNDWSHIVSTLQTATGLTRLEALLFLNATHAHGTRLTVMRLTASLEAFIMHTVNRDRDSSS